MELATIAREKISRGECSPSLGSMINRSRKANMKQQTANPYRTTVELRSGGINSRRTVSTIRGGVFISSAQTLISHFVRSLSSIATERRRERVSRKLSFTSSQLHCRKRQSPMKSCLQGRNANVSSFHYEKGSDSTLRNNSVPPGYCAVRQPLEYCRSCQRLPSKANGEVRGLEYAELVPQLNAVLSLYGIFLKFPCSCYTTRAHELLPLPPS